MNSLCLSNLQRENEYVCLYVIWDFRAPDNSLYLGNKDISVSIPGDVQLDTEDEGPSVRLCNIPILLPFSSFVSHNSQIC